MRTTRFPLATSVGVAILLTSSIAAADVAGTYDVKFEEVSNNCTSPLRYPHGRLGVKVKSGSGITVEIDRTPKMQGSVTKAGKVSAKSKSESTPIGGMNGVFSVAGKITPEGMLSLVMIGEYTDASNGRALCTQSWNVAGSKSDEPAAKPKKAATETVLDLPSMLR